MTKRNEELPDDITNELRFVFEIHRHENRLIDDIEISSMFNKYKVAHFLTTIITILGIIISF